MKYTMARNAVSKALRYGLQRVQSNPPLSLVGALVSPGLGDAVQGLLQQVLPESLSHLSQGIH